MRTILIHENDWRIGVDWREDELTGPPTSTYESHRFVVHRQAMARVLSLSIQRSATMARIGFPLFIRISTLFAGLALAAVSGAASAHVSVGIGFGFPGVVYAPPPPPVYYAPPPPPPVYYAPPPPPAVVYQQVPAPVVYGEDWREREWREHQAWRARQEYERRRAYYGYGY
jgi:hypothetical protein